MAYYGVVCIWVSVSFYLSFALEGGRTVYYTRLVLASSQRPAKQKKGERLLVLQYGSNFSSSEFCNLGLYERQSETSHALKQPPSTPPRTPTHDNPWQPSRFSLPEH